METNKTILPIQKCIEVALNLRVRINCYNASMKHYVIEGEALNSLFGENKVGNTIYEPTQYWLMNESFNVNNLTLGIMTQITGKDYVYNLQIADPISNHSIGAFKNILR